MPSHQEKQDENPPCMFFPSFIQQIRKHPKTQKITEGGGLKPEWNILTWCCWWMNEYILPPTQKTSDMLAGLRCGPECIAFTQLKTVVTRGPEHLWMFFEWSDPQTRSVLQAVIKTHKHTTNGINRVYIFSCAKPSWVFYYFIFFSFNPPLSSNFFQSSWPQTVSTTIKLLIRFHFMYSCETMLWLIVSRWQQQRFPD